MATNYPGSLDTSTQQPSPSASTEMDDSGFEHDVVHANHSGAIIAVETKVGTGASTPVADSVLGGTGSGTSAWTTTPTLGGLTVDTDTLHVDATNNRVGIGTTSPSVPLHISDDAHAIMRLQNEGTGNTEGPTVELYGNTGRMGLLGFDNTDDIRIKNETSAGKLFFFTNNSVRATILPSGNVGIGTDSPANTLHVNGGTANFIARLESTDSDAYLGLQDGSSSSAGHVAVGAIGDDLVLRAGNSNAVRVKAHGDVGIGTTSPGQRLHVNSGATNTAAVFESTDTEVILGLKDDTTSGNAHVGIRATGDDLSLRAGNTNQVVIYSGGTAQFAGAVIAANGTAANPAFSFTSDSNTGMLRSGTDELGFATGGTQRVTIASDGDVGIGTTSPDRQLDIEGNVPAVRLTDSNNAGVYHEILGDGASLSIEADDNNQAADSSINFKVDGTEYARLSSDGFLGIGSINPGRPLEIKHNFPAIRLKDTSTSDHIFHDFLGDGDGLSIRADANGDATSPFINFQIGGSQKAVITSDGRLGIGTTSPAALLDVAGDTTSTGHFTAQSGGADGGIVLGQTFSSSYVGLRTAGMGEASANEYVIMSSGTHTFVSAGSSGDVYIRGGANNSSCQIQLDTSENNIAVTGNMQVGTSSTDYKMNLYRQDTGTADHINIYNGSTLVGTIGSEDSTWLRFNQEVAKNIYTPRLLRADGGFQAGNGSTSAPAYSFQSDSNTGFYVTGNGGVIRFVGNGTEGGYLWAGGIRTVNGSAATPSHSFVSDTNTGMYRYGADEIGFSIGGAVAASITGHINVHGTDSALVAYDPPTGTGNDAEWVSVFGVYLLRRNSSTAAEKLSIQEDLEGWLTPDMVDSVVPKMWTRDHAPDYPEIGPIADDMDAISPFLGVKGTNEDGDQVLTGIDRNAYLSLLVLAVKDLRTRVVELENA